MAPALAVAILAAHVAIVIWAISNRHPWWGIGIFLFPIVGDLAYFIYYFGSRPPAPPRASRVPSSDVSVGDEVRTTLLVRLRESKTWLPRRTHGRVLERQEDALGIQLQDGRVVWLRYDQVEVLRAPLPPPEAGPSVPSTANSSPNAVSLAAELRELRALRNEGLITEEEFTAKKRQILGI